jgi:hypothetical protein
MLQGAPSNGLGAVYCRRLFSWPMIKIDTMIKRWEHPRVLSDAMIATGSVEEPEQSRANS